MLKKLWISIAIAFSAVLGLLGAVWVGRKIQDEEIENEIKNELSTRDTKLRKKMYEKRKKIAADKSHLDTINNLPRRDNEIRDRTRIVVEKFRKYRKNKF